MTTSQSAGGCPVRHETGHLRVVGHAEVVAVVTDPETFSSGVSRFLQVPNGLDGQEHAAFRAVIDRFFTTEALAELEPRLRGVARRLVAVLPRGEVIDVVSGMGTRYAVQAMLAWLGWDPDLEEELVGWVADNAAATRSGEIERTRAVAEHFDAIIVRVLQPRLERLDEPARDVTDQLLRQRVQGRGLQHPELVSILRNWTGGDLGSLALCVGVIIHQLAALPTLFRELHSRLGDAEATNRAIDELLRIDDPFVSNRRISTRATELAGESIGAGQRLVVDWTRANRDPGVFPYPDAFRPEENAPENLVYGRGPHVCPGRGLATLELRVLLEELLPAISGIELPEQPRAVRAEFPLGGWASRPVILR